jgi:hypothetical protein
MFSACLLEQADSLVGMQKSADIPVTELFSPYFRRRMEAADNITNIDLFQAPRMSLPVILL